MSRTILLRSGGSTDLKTNNSFSLDKECEMKAVKMETKIIKLYSCDWKEVLVRQWGSHFRKSQHKTKHVFPWNIINIQNTFLNIPSPSLTAFWKFKQAHIKLHKETNHIYENISNTYERIQSFPTHIKQNMLTNTYRTYFHAHKCQKGLLHLSWNWLSDYLSWKNCFRWQTATQIFSNGIQYMLRRLTQLWTAISQREVCYCQATVFVNQKTSLFWQMQDSCPFMLCKLWIQPFWEVTICDRYEGTCSNKTPGTTHPKIQHHSPVDLNPQQCWCENLKSGIVHNFTVKEGLIFIN